MLNKATIARPYAKAVFKQALKTETLEFWTEFLKGISELVKQPKARQFILSPCYTAKQRLDFILELAQSLSLTKEALNFLKILAFQKRFGILEEIRDLFEFYRIQHEQKLNVSVYSACTLGPEEQEKLRIALTKRLKREVILAVKIDPMLIAGLILRTEDLVIDVSLKGQLSRMSALLAN